MSQFRSAASVLMLLCACGRCASNAPTSLPTGDANTEDAVSTVSPTTTSPGPSPTSAPTLTPTPTPAPTTPTNLTFFQTICSAWQAPSPSQSPLAGIGTLTPLAVPAADHYDGPVWLGDQNMLVYSTWMNTPQDGNGPRSTIYGLQGSSATVLSAAGIHRTNGLATDAAGALLAAAHDRREIARFDMPGLTNRSTLCNRYNNLPFNSCNDLAVRSDGTVYFTDPGYQADGRSGQAAQRAYAVSPAGSVGVVAADMSEPNGIALSLDEAFLYVGGAGGVIRRYAVAADGSTSIDDATFIIPATNIDGMTLDCEGNLYVALYDQRKIGVYKPSGAAWGTIDVPDNVTNLAFGGSDRRTLFVTTNTQLLSVKLRLPGLPY